MTTALALPLPDALDAAYAAGAPLDAWNPIYAELRASTPDSRSTDLDDQQLDLLIRHITAPAVMVLAVEAAGVARRVRLGIHGGGATVESSENDPEAALELSHWSEAALEDLPRLLADALPADSPLSASPQLTVRSDATALRLGTEHLSRLQELLQAGHAPHEAFARLESLDPRLQDALTATGDRASLSLTLHAADPAVLERPVSFSRLWNCGELGTYRTDASDQPGIDVVPVQAGDVLGTGLPLLEQAIRFASEATARPRTDTPHSNDNAGHKGGEHLS